MAGAVATQQQATHPLTLSGQMHPGGLGGQWKPSKPFYPDYANHAEMRPIDNDCDAIGSSLQNPSDLKSPH